MKRLRYFISGLLLVTMAQIVAAEEINEIGKNRFETDKIELTSPVASEKMVTISSAVNLSGKLVIWATESTQAVFTFKKILKSATKSDAIEFARVINVVLDKTSNGANLILQAPNPAPWSGTDNFGIIEGTLQIPKNSNIIIDAQYFDLDITGPFKKLENKTSFGRAEIENISELLDLTTSNQDIIASHITGEVNLTTSHADIKLTDIVTSGQLATIENENGSINGEMLSGVFDIRNSFGRIRLSELTLVSDRSKISGSYCPIDLWISNINQAGLTIRNNNEDIEIYVPDSLDAEFSLRVDNDGEIDVEGLEINPSLVENSRLDFISGNGGSKIRVSIRDEGNITVRGN